jgi:hypothetical protein
MAGVTPSSDATASVAHFALARQFLSALVMPHSFHIGNRVSSAKVSNPGIRPFPNGNYNVSMIDRIGSKRPSRLYIREWIKKRSLDQKRIAERMNCEPGTVSKLLNGSMEMTTKWLGAIRGRP